MPKIAPSMLSADFLRLEKDVEMVNGCADLFHLDIMDGVFVPNISYGFPVAHLMIVSPEKYVERFARAGASMISFHAEATEAPERVLELIRSFGVKAGLAFNPDYPLEKVYPYLKSCDFVLVMSVFAGFGGQKFIPDTWERLASLKEEIIRQDAGCLVEVDGGVSPDNAARLAAAGADILVAGSAVFRAPDPAAVVAQMKNA